jgi:hypothetical protein
MPAAGMRSVQMSMSGEQMSMAGERFALQEII